MADAPSPPRVELVYQLQAAVDAVYQAWTDAELLAQWFGPSDGVQADAELDLRVGGRYRITMGSRTVRGVYLEVSPPTRLAFTWVWDDDDPPVETEVRVSLTPEGPSLTRMVIEHERLPDEVSCMGFEQGWRRTVVRLERWLAVGGTPPGT